MARRRQPSAAVAEVDEAGRVNGRLFTRTPEAWRELGVPDFMVDEPEAVLNYDSWCPGAGHSLLRMALGGSVPGCRIESLKARFIREVAAPRLLWNCGGVLNDERAHLLAGKYVPSVPAASWSKSAPAWLTGPAPWTPTVA